MILPKAFHPFYNQLFKLLIADMDAKREDVNDKCRHLANQWDSKTTPIFQWGLKVGLKKIPKDVECFAKYNLNERAYPRKGDALRHDCFSSVEKDFHYAGAMWTQDLPAVPGGNPRPYITMETFYDGSSMEDGVATWYVGLYDTSPEFSFHTRNLQIGTCKTEAFTFPVRASACQPVADESPFPDPVEELLRCCGSRVQGINVLLLQTVQERLRSGNVHAN